MKSNSGNPNPVVEEKKGILLDIGCYDVKQEGFLGLATNAGPVVDIVHNIEEFPYPLPDNSCLTVLVPNTIHKIKPWLTVDFFNEMWRILKPNCQLALSIPYAGSPMYWQDPMSCNGFTESTFFYFDRRFPQWNIYKPKPWLMDKGFPVWQATGVIEAVMRKVDDSKI